MNAPHDVATIEAWLLRLKAGVDAGYYRTESAVSEQEPFPWQGKTCKDCPFWKNLVCTVRMTARSASAHTCVYFDEPHRTAAETIIKGRNGSDPWWDNFYGSSRSPSS